MKKPILFLVLLAIFFTNLPLTTSLAETSNWNTPSLLEDCEDAIGDLANDGNLDNATSVAAAATNCGLIFELSPKHKECDQLGRIKVKITSGRAPYLVEWDNEN